MTGCHVDPGKALEAGATDTWFWEPGTHVPGSAVPRETQLRCSL